MNEVLATFAVLFGLAAFLPYFRDTLSGTAQPHPYTWLIWALTQGTAVVGIWYGGGGAGAVAPTIGVLYATIIFLVSLKWGGRHITRMDSLILSFALVAIVVWWKFDEPEWAVMMVLVIDMCGYIPSWRKSAVSPWSETLWPWFAFSVSNVLSLLALDKHTLLTAAYLSAITVANLIVIGICLRFRRIRSQSSVQ